MTNPSETEIDHIVKLMESEFEDIKESPGTELLSLEKKYCPARFTCCVYTKDGC